LTNPIDSFQADCLREIEAQSRDENFRTLTSAWFNAANNLKYSYHFSALGRPIIQYPQDMVAVQELIWAVQPDLIIETGIAHGGSLILSAAMLALIDYSEASAAGVALDPRATGRKVIGIDIDIRAHNRTAIKAHALSHKIEMIEGSSIDSEIIQDIRERALGFRKVLVFLDSNHTHDHVLAELEAYAPLTSRDSYCVVFDTVIEDMPHVDFGNRPWKVGDNPKTAVWEYLKRLKSDGRSAADGKPLHFEIDKVIENRVAVTVAPDGYLKRVD